MNKKEDEQEDLKEEIVEHIVPALMAQDQNTKGNLPGKQEAVWHADCSPGLSGPLGCKQSTVKS